MQKAATERMSSENLTKPFLFSSDFPDTTVKMAGGVGQGSEKWIAQIAALLGKMPSVGQTSF